MNYYIMFFARLIKTIWFVFNNTYYNNIINIKIGKRLLFSPISICYIYFSIYLFIFMI